MSDFFMQPLEYFSTVPLIMMIVVLLFWSIVFLRAGRYFAAKEERDPFRMVIGFSVGLMLSVAACICIEELYTNHLVSPKPTVVQQPAS